MTTEKEVKPELTDEEKRQKLDEHYEAIKQAELEVQASENDMIRAQYDLKDSKKQYEGAVLHLRRLISRVMTRKPHAPCGHDWRFPKIKREFRILFPTVFVDCCCTECKATWVESFVRLLYLSRI